MIFKLSSFVRFSHSSNTILLPKHLLTCSHALDAHLNLTRRTLNNISRRSSDGVGLTKAYNVM